MAQAADLQTFDGNIDHFGSNPYVADEKLPVRFYMGSEEDPARTEEEKRPCFRPCEYIVIYNSKDNVVERPVRDTDKQRWPRAYGMWKSTGESTPGAGGTPLEHFPMLNRAQVEELKYFKIFTVEALADWPDSGMERFMGAQKLKAMAKAYLQAAEGSKPVLEMQKQLEQRDQQILVLMDQVTKLCDQLEKIMKQVGEPAA